VPLGKNPFDEAGECQKRVYAGRGPRCASLFF
jgi:hypothetical protein